MASSREYLDFILEQLSDIDEISCRPMMGEYIIYYQGKVIGGIYDDRFLVKPTAEAVALTENSRLEAPYEGAKGMLVVEELENREYLKKLMEAVYAGLKK